MKKISQSAKHVCLGVLFGFFFISQAYSQKVIVDCDPGIDDALALILAMESRELEILGITTVYGNVTTDQATKNTLRLLHIAGKNIPVYAGSKKPLELPFEHPTAEYHGEDGLGNTDLPLPDQKAEAQTAADFMVRMAKEHPGELTIIALGSLTNLAKALVRDSGFHENVKQVIVMGGAIRVPGNVSPVAEFNIANDPHAADKVFTTPWRVVMVGLDVTTQVELKDSLIHEIKKGNSSYGSFIHTMSRYYLANEDSPVDQLHLHDPSAVMYLITPGIFSVQQGAVRVVTEGIARGQTIFASEDWHHQLEPWINQPFVIVALDVDAERYLEIYMAVMGEGGR